MTHPHLLSIAFATLLVPGAGLAQTTDLNGLGQTYELAQNRDYTDVVRGLEAVDYTIEGISTTLLGRTRIIANNGDHRREVIVSRTTGEVLSDLVLDLPASADAVARQSALDAASEPKTDGSGSSIDFSGSLSVGINSKSGGYGKGSISARKENIGGSGITGSVTYSDGY